MTYAYAFSPTGGTQKIARAVATAFDPDVNLVDFTHYHNRMKNGKPQTPSFGPDDVVFIAVPVYAGRVPNVLISYLKSFAGNGALGIALLSYGNRHFDDALVELVDIMLQSGFTVIASGAFIAQHAFSETLAKGRPDDLDLKEARTFGEDIQKLISKSKTAKSDVSLYQYWIDHLPGERPYRAYYQPLNKFGVPYEFKRIRPISDETCIDCGTCKTQCPVPGICIKCQACIKTCPVKARHFKDEDFIHHKEELEDQYGEQRLENKVWLFDFDLIM